MSLRHVLVGAGPASINALETIRRTAPGDTVTMVSDEPAHSRMALPYWLSGKIPRQQTHLGDAAYFQRLGADTRFGVRAAAIDVAARRIELTDGSSLPFDRLLLATGSRPLGLPVPGADLPTVQPMWTLAHAQQALDRVGRLARPHVALIGAGFIGMIVLNAMFQRGWRLTVIERQAEILPRMLPASAAALVSRWLAERGVSVHRGVDVSGIKGIKTDGQRTSVHLADGATIDDLDLVIVATGVAPNRELATEAGIETRQGILVDRHLETSVAGIFAAGDVAEGPVLGSVERQVHAIQPTAVDHGRIAGANMAGTPAEYPGSLSMNVLDVCGLQCASFGICDAAQADRMTISHPDGFIHREWIWNGDRLAGAVFIGRAADAGMLTDVGMAKGLIQTQVPLGPWKGHLAEHPFDLRRAYIASGAPAQLARFTLLGRPAEARGFRFGDAPLPSSQSSHHAVFFPG